MDLAGLKTYLDGLGPTFTLASGDANLPTVLQDLLATMPGKAIALTPAQGGIAIDGSVLTVTATSAATWPVTGLGSAKIVLSTAVLTVTDAATPSAGAILGGQLPLGGGASAGVTVMPFQGSSTWTVALTGVTGSVTPTELIVLGTGTTLPFAIPPKLDLFTEVATADPKAFEIRFTPEGGQPAAYRFGVSVKDATWTLIPKIIDFDGMDLAALIGGGGWAVTVIGHLTVGGVPLDIGAQFGNGPVWQAFVQPTTGDTFPGIVEFADWIVGGSGQGTAQGFADIGLNPKAFDLALSRVTLSFDPAKAEVKSLVIASELTIVGLTLDLGLTLPDLTLTGALHDGKPVKVVDMLTEAGLSTGSVPQGLTIAEASFSAAPKDGSYSVDVEVDGIWTEGPVKLETIKASVDYAKVAGSSSQSPFTGRFEAVIGLGDVAEIDLEAEYAGGSAGWTFSGGLLAGTTVKMSDVIKELGSTWGIGSVPSPLESLTLTALSVSYQTGTKTFSFNCAGGFAVDKTDVKVVFSIDLAPTSAKGAGSGEIAGSKGYTAKFGGSVKFGGNTFEIVFDTESTGTDIFVADYVHTGDPVALAELIADVSASIAADIPGGIKIDLKEVKFVFLAQKGQPNLWAFGLRLGSSFALNEIPVIGSKLPPDLTLSVDKLQILYASADLGDVQAGTINAILPKDVTPLPAAGAGKGIAFEADLTVGSFKKHLQAGVAPPAKTKAAALPAPAARATAAAPVAAGSNGPASGSDPIQWLDLQKQIGVFNFRRVGVGYVDNVLEIALDASLAVGPLAFSVDGLTVGSPLTEFKPQFSFRGLSLSFEKPPIDIGGSFLRATDIVNGKDVTSFYGQLNVQVSSFGLKAVGGWTPETGSFFIYLSIDAPIGGPPALFVTGVAGGLGLNTSLTLPTVDNVGTYILLPGSAPKPAGSARETIANVLTALRDTIHPEVGQYWVAAGISFTSFEMIKARAVISVAFGVETQIGVVGTVAMTFPTGAPNPVAYIEVDIVASFTPSTGLLSVDGRINPASNLFAGFVKLSGGFAFYIWFSGPNSGNFVVTLGGYHPAFDKPAIYPVVPRLGLSFALGPFKVVGAAYFALTPGAFMAGLRISATWSLGPIKAWFDAGVDFLIAWAPFHYEADAFVGIGCSVDLGLVTLNIHIGADLYIWGPEFGGRADIDLDVVSFSIEFGASRQAPPPVGWQTFAEKFLPAPSGASAQMFAAALPGAAPPPPKPITNVIRATVEAGKLRDGSGAVDWIVDPDAFRILTASTVPANRATWATGPKTEPELPNILADYRRTDPVPALLSPAVALALRTAPPPPPPPSAPPGMALILSRNVETASPTEVWEPELHIGPMDERDVISTHAIALTKADAKGDFTDYIATFSVEPVLAPSSTALWGKKKEKPAANDDRLVEYTLTGFRISAVPRTPARVSGIPLLELIYGTASSVDYTAETATVDSRYAVTSATPDDDLTITITGAVSETLPNKHFVLNSIGDAAVAGRRATILDDLVANGFATTPSAKIDVTLFATATALTDWPRAALLGAAA